MDILFDLNPDYFINNSYEILKNIDKTDYINLFLNNVVHTLSSDINYVLTEEELK